MQSSRKNEKMFRQKYQLKRNVDKNTSDTMGSETSVYSIICIVFREYAESDGIVKNRKGKMHGICNHHGTVKIIPYYTGLLAAE